MSTLIPSGNIRLEYLNNTAYLNYPDYGWMESGSPTPKLQTIIKESDRLTKDKWAFVKPNESFIGSEATAAYDLVMPTYWNTSGNYPKSNGIGYNDDAKLHGIVEAENTYTGFISPNVSLNPSGTTYDMPNEAYSSYTPELCPGYIHLADSKAYMYANKVTKVIKTYSDNSVYYFNMDDIDERHPVYYKQSSSTYATIRDSLRNTESPEPGILTVESGGCLNRDESEVIPGVSPYTPFVVTNNVDKLNAYNMEHLIFDGVESTKPITTTYINYDEGFIHIENPTDGVIILMYNKKGTEYTTPHNMDASPITWDAKDRAISIVSGLTTPYHTNVYMPTQRVGNVSGSLPVVINIRDDNGIPVSGFQFAVNNKYYIKDVDGNTLDSAETNEVTVSGVSLLELSNLSVSKHIVLNNRAVGYAYVGRRNTFTEPYPGVLGSTFITNEYGTAYLDLALKPYNEPVSLVEYYYEVSGITSTLPDSTIIKIEMERQDIITNMESNFYGHYVTNDYIPMLSPQVRILNLGYEDIPVSGWVYGFQALAYEFDNWMDTRDTYVVLDAYPSGDYSVIMSSTLSGQYAVVYDEVLETCL